MSAPPLFTGVGVALVTLFDDDGEVDLAATAGLAADLVQVGLRAIVIAGSTGEAATLDGAERVALAKVVREALPAGVPVIVGTGAPSARQAARLTAEVVAGGAADGLLVLSPPGAADPVGYYAEIVRAAGDIPVLAYHFPAMSAPGIDVDTLPRLTDVGVAGVKDSSGDPSRLLRTLDAVRRLALRRFAVVAVRGRPARGDGRHPRRRQRRTRAVDRRLRRRRRGAARASR